MTEQQQPRTEIRTIGYIGLGHAGFLLAKYLALHLSAPAPLERILVADADPARAQAFVDQVNALDGEQHARAELGDESSWAQCDLLMTMVPNGDVVRHVLFGGGTEDGKKGVAVLLRPGTVVVDTSSSDPFNTMEMEKELREKHGLYLVDAAVTQERDRAIGDGEVTYLVGGQEAAIDAALPALRCTSKYVFKMGGPGRGHLAKTLNNYVSASSIAALFDAAVLGTKLGLDPLALTHAFNVGTAQTFCSKWSMLRDGLTGTHDSQYNLALLVKDLRINERAFTSQLGGQGAQDGYPTHVRSRFEHALKLLDGDPALCHTTALRAWEQQAGVKVKQYDDTSVGKTGL